MILDLSKKEHVPLINQYKKCKGISLVEKYLPELSPLNKMYVINSEEDWEKVKDEFPINMMTVRCDSPRGIEGKLPEGLYIRHEELSRDGMNHFGVELNVVQDGRLVPFEIDVPERFKEKESQER